jgi:hypothetical protein
VNTSSRRLADGKHTKAKTSATGEHVLESDSAKETAILINLGGNCRSLQCNKECFPMNANIPEGRQLIALLKMPVNEYKLLLIDQIRSDRNILSGVSSKKQKLQANTDAVAQSAAGMLTQSHRKLLLVQKNMAGSGGRAMV